VNFKVRILTVRDVADHVMRYT